MDPETILNEYVGALNTEQTREAIRTRLVSANREMLEASTRQLFSSTATREDIEDATAIRAWGMEAGTIMQARLNESINTGIISTPRGPSMVDYGERYTFNYNYSDPNQFITVGDNGTWGIAGVTPMPQKTITANFVEIVSNPNNDGAPFMCQTGEATIIEGSEKFFEEYDIAVIKSNLKEMVFRVLKSEPGVNTFMISTSMSANKRWICKKPLKAVDIIKETLDDALCEMTQRFYATQKKLQQFKLIKG